MTERKLVGRARWDKELGTYVLEEMPKNGYEDQVEKAFGVLTTDQYIATGAQPGLTTEKITKLVKQMQAIPIPPMGPIKNHYIKGYSSTIQIADDPGPGLESSPEGKKMSTNYHAIFEAARMTQEQGEIGTHTVVLLIGDPGVGKNHLVYDYGKSINYYVGAPILLGNMDNLDVGGLYAPDFVADKLKHMITDRFLGNVPDGYDGEIVFLDEIANATAELQTAIQSILDTRMHEGRPVGKNVIFMAACNKPDTGCGGGEMLNSAKARFIPVEVEVDNDRWMKWALDTEIDDRIKGFINYSVGSLHEFNPESEEFGQPNPRAWHKLSSMLSFCKDDTLLPTLSRALVGMTEGMKFAGFCKLDGELATVEEVLDDWETALVTENSFSSQYAIISNIASWLARQKKASVKVSKDDKASITKYLKRMHEPIAVFGLKLLEKASGDFVVNNPEYADFIVKYSEYDL
jgi:hypothetical protein